MSSLEIILTCTTITLIVGLSIQFRVDKLEKRIKKIKNELKL